MPTLQPAEFDNSPVSKQSIIQAPIMYPVTDAPAPPMMVDYLGAPPSSGAKLATAMAPASSMEMSESPAPASSLDYTAYDALSPSTAISLTFPTGDSPESAPPDFAYATPSSRMGAPR